VTTPPKPGGDALAAPSERAQKKKGPPEAQALTPEQIEEAIGDLEKRLDRLRALYDMYFTGIERIEPSIQRKDVDRRVYQLRKEQIRNTGLRFRFNMLVQRYNTMLTYWMRVSRAIEEGRWRRDVLKKREAIEEARRKRRGEADVYEVSDDDLELVEEDAEAAAAEIRPSRPPAALLPVERPAGAAAAPAGKGLVFRRPKSEVAMQAVRTDQSLSEARLRQIYDRYLEVRRECKESVHNVPYEKMAKALRGMVPELQKKAPGKNVDFEVTIKNGKAFLKPVAK
jgi:hypothetical protein